MIRSLVLLWGFPNQLSSDSWAVGFEEADPCSALDCETTNGSGSKIFCPGEKVMWAAMQQTTGCSLMRFFTDIERESLGVIRPRVLATGTSYTSALTDGDVRYITKSKSPLQKTEQLAACWTSFRCRSSIIPAFQRHVAFSIIRSADATLRMGKIRSRSNAVLVIPRRAPEVTREC